MRYGLSDATINGIVSVLSRHPRIVRAILYGSRAKGTYRSGSDIDIVLDGHGIDFGELARITSELDDLSTPYGFDISILSAIDNPALLDHINRVGAQLFPAMPGEIS